MKVVLRQDVDKLGNKGDLVTVADGYARNYLVPRGLALKADRGAVAQATAMRRNRENREARERASAEALVPRLMTTVIEVKARAGEGGKLFGSVTSADIVTAVAENTGVELDRRKVLLAEPLKALGPAEVAVHLHRDVRITLNVEVVPL